MVVASCGKEEFRTVKKDAATPGSNEPPKPVPGDTVTTATGDGSPESPFCIATANEWTKVMSQYAKDTAIYYKLTGSFEVETVVDTFRGTLDGNGMTLSVTNQAIFKVLDRAMVHDVSVSASVSCIPETSKVYIFNAAGSRDLYYAPLACYAQEGTTIMRCRSHVNIRLGDEWGYIAPLCGGTLRSYIDQCATSGRITAQRGFYAGIVSLADTQSVVRNSQTDVVISGSECQIGGIVYLLRLSRLENSYSTASLSTSDSYNLGGLACFCREAIVDNCYFFGSLASEGASLLCYQASKDCHVHHCYGGINDPDATLLPLVTRASLGSIVEECYRMRTATTLAEATPQGTTSLLSLLQGRASAIDKALSWQSSGGLITFSD